MWDISDLAARMEGLSGFDVILAIHAILYRLPEVVRQVYYAKRLSTPLVLWTLDCLNPSWHGGHYGKLYENILSTAEYWDLVATSDGSVNLAERVKKHIHLPQGVSPIDFTAEPQYQDNPPFDVMFMGSVRSNTPHRNEMLKRIASEFRLCTYNENNTISGAKQFGRVSGNEITAAQTNSAVMYVPAPEFGIQRYWSNRIYLATAAGACCVAEFVEGLEEEFTSGENVWFAYNPDDVIESINFLCKNPEMRHEIGKNARKWTMERYTYAQRCRVLLGAL